MVEKIRTIKNPLTIIAIFAGIAEVSGSAVLPFLSIANQSDYVWFLMIFPILLISYFFLTLNFNHKVLYAPSDFRDEETFYKLIMPASATQREEKLREQAREIEAETYEAKLSTQTKPSRIKTRDAAYNEPRTRALRAKYSLAEELILNKISKDIGKPIRRDMFLTSTNDSIMFDGVIMDRDGVTAIEVKYFVNVNSIPLRFENTLHKISHFVEGLPKPVRDRFTLILALGTENPATDNGQLVNQLNNLVKEQSFPIDIKFFTIEELEKETGLE